jgi:cysteinyl-tRNA synthetase
VLWKPSDENTPGWDSPWGRGRPGWHIECSAMSWKHLGEVFDIHGGGIDLVFPHHENEIAQSRCSFHTPMMANYWMHNGFLQVEGEKMSKSLGNFFTIHDLLTDWPGGILRFQMLKTHYRQPIDWTKKGTETAALELDGYYTFTEHCDRTKGEVSTALIEALADDLNTPQAITELRRLVDECRKSASPDSQAARDLFASCTFLGIELSSYRDVVRLQRGDVDEVKVVSLIDARNAARKAKNFKEADRIRDELHAMGIELEDKKDGTTAWKVKR